MATIYHTVVQPNGKIEIDVPELAPGQSVTITVAPETSATTGAAISNGGDAEQATPKPKRRAADFIAESPERFAGKTSDEIFEEMRGKHVLDIVAMLPGHQLFKTAEEVDAYIREERDSWGD